MHCVLFNPNGCSEIGENRRPIDVKGQLALLREGQASEGRGEGVAKPALRPTRRAGKSKL